ncbi:hypothetical protein ACHAXN_002383 [Cyclotella atomus]
MEKMNSSIHKKQSFAAVVDQDFNTTATFRRKDLLTVILGIMIPIGFMFILTVKSYIEANNSRSSVQTSLPSACTATGNTPTNSFCSAAGNAPVIDYARNAWVTHVHQSVTQTIEGNEEEKTKSSQRYTEMEKYLENWVASNGGSERLKHICTNKHHLCVYWASIGECESNPVFMEQECILACQMCAYSILVK